MLCEFTHFNRQLWNAVDYNDEIKNVPLPPHFFFLQTSKNITKMEKKKKKKEKKLEMKVKGADVIVIQRE